MLFEMRKVEETGSRMRMSGFKGGVGGESDPACSQSAGRVEVTLYTYTLIPSHKSHEMSVIFYLLL
jgi:hypothetical protein